MLAAATTITPVLASAARILGIGSQQKLERKGIVNKRIYPYYLAGTMIAMAGILHLVVASHVLGGVNGIIRSLVGPGPSPHELTLKRGQSVEIKVNISTTRVSSPPSPLDLNIKTVASGTFTPTGDLGNSTGFFSEQSFSLEPMHTKQVSFI